MLLGPLVGVMLARGDDPSNAILAGFAIALAPCVVIVCTFWVDIVCNPRYRRYRR